MREIRAALYARVSSEQQAAAHTIESQRAALTDRARADGAPVPAERQFLDDGHSGATLVRPALDRLRDLVMTRAIDRIYVHSPDRLARNYAYQVLLVDEWRRAGVDLVFLNRPLGQSPEDDLLLQVQGIVAEYERAKIMERSRRGKKHAAQRGLLNVMSGAPFGYRYVAVRDGGGQARFEVDEERARVVRQIFTWVGRDRCSLAEVCRCLQKAGEMTKTGKTIWSRQTVWHILQNPAYQGRAAFGKTHMMLHTKYGRLRPRRGQLSEPQADRVAGDTDKQKWVFIEVPALVEPALFQAAQQQLHENWSRARPGRNRPGYLLQGLTCCALCGYAYYGKTTHQKGAGGCLRDFRYYRCSGTDGYRFGGDPLCSNSQVRGDLLEYAVWGEICKLLNNPRSLQQEDQLAAEAAKQAPEIERLQAQLLKLQHGLGRIVDSYAEGLIEKDQFTSRMKQNKARIADLEGRLSTTSDSINRQQQLQLLSTRLAELSKHLGPRFEDTEWSCRREVIRTIVQRIEIRPAAVTIVPRFGASASICISRTTLVARLPQACSEL
jgi:site-specific DNA recombinase